MGEHKKHKEQEAGEDTGLKAQEPEEAQDDEGRDIPEEKAHKHRKQAVHKKELESKPKPHIGYKIKYASYATLSATERIIQGLSSIYEHIFVGKAEEEEEEEVNFHKDQGMKLFDKGDYKNAAVYFRSCLEAEGEKDTDVLLLLAQCCQNLEQYKEAAEYYKKAEKLDPDNQEIVLELGRCLYDLEDYAEAAGYFKKAAETSPDDADVYYHFGSCLEKIDQPEEAKAMYKKAIDLAPREAVYYQALGFVYENSGGHKDAIVCFKKAMDLERKKK